MGPHAPELTSPQSQFYHRTIGILKSLFYTCGGSGTTRQWEGIQTQSVVPIGPYCTYNPMGPPVQSYVPSPLLLRPQTHATWVTLRQHDYQMERRHESYAHQATGRRRYTTTLSRSLLIATLVTRRAVYRLWATCRSPTLTGSGEVYRLWTARPVRTIPCCRHVPCLCAAWIW